MFNALKWRSGEDIGSLARWLLIDQIQLPIEKIDDLGEAPRGFKLPLGSKEDVVGILITAQQDLSHSKSRLFLRASIDGEDRHVAPVVDRIIAPAGMGYFAAVDPKQKIEFVAVEIDPATLTAVIIKKNELRHSVL